MYIITFKTVIDGEDINKKRYNLSSWQYIFKAEKIRVYLVLNTTRNSKMKWW